VGGPQLRRDPARGHDLPIRGPADREQLAEQRAPGDELGLRADVDHPSLVEDGDPVGQRQRGAPVGDEQGGAALRERAQRVVDGGFGGGVDRGRGVVEHQHPRVGEHRPGQRDPLPLPAGEREPALADERVVAVGEALDERVHLRGPRGGQHLGLRGVGAAVGDVGPDGVGEQERLLEHHAQLAAQVDQPQRRQRHPAEAQLALLRVVEARQEQPDRGLARTRRPDQRERLPRRHGEADPVEHRLAARVAERDAVELHAQRTLRQGGGVLRSTTSGCESTRSYTRSTPARASWAATTSTPSMRAGPTSPAT
jgi:hypothetical protein